MSLEEEMHHEAARLESEIKEIDTQLKKIQEKILRLTALRQKKGHNLKALKDSFGEEYIEDLERILKGKESIIR